MKDILIHLSKIRWLIFVFFFASCGSASHHFYAGDEGNLLAVKEKGDLKASAGITPHLNSLPGNNVNVQLGYSPFKHFALHTNFFRIRNSFEGLEEEEKNVYQYNFSGAIGTYLFKSSKIEVNEEKNSEVNRGLLFDFYVGYGQGEVDNFFFGKTGKIELDFQKYFAQGGVHIFLDRVEASFALRYAQVRYLNGSAFGKLTTSELAKKDVIQDNNPFNFLESALKVSYGKTTSPLRAFMTITGVYDFGDVFLEIQPSTLQLGVTADIDHYFRK